jgi:hypothetical protein
MPTPSKGPRHGWQCGAPAPHACQPRHRAVRAQGYHHHREPCAPPQPVAEKLISKAKRGRPPRPPDRHDPVRRKDIVASSSRSSPHEDRRSRRRVHPDHEARPPQGRQRPDGPDRAGPSSPSRSASRPRRRWPQPVAEPAAEPVRAEPVEEVEEPTLDDDQSAVEAESPRRPTRPPAPRRPRGSRRCYARGVPDGLPSVVHRTMSPRPHAAEDAGERCPPRARVPRAGRRVVG